MKKEINFKSKEFKLLDNSAKGQVDAQTRFIYDQDEDLVTADYFGGSVKYGKIIGLLEGEKLKMRYSCLTMDKILKSGRAEADISYTLDGKMKLHLKWSWFDSADSGTSTYIEI